MSTTLKYKKKSEVQENQTNKYSLKTYRVKINKTTEEMYKPTIVNNIENVNKSLNY